MQKHTLVLVAMLLASCASAPTGHHLYVAPAPDGEWDDPSMADTIGTFTTIQAAIDAASAGDTVVVPSGTYVENVTMADGVSVAGAGRDETYIVGTISFLGLTTETTLSGVSVFDSNYASGGAGGVYDCIGIDGDDAIIRDVGAYYCRYGIYALAAGAVTVDNARLGGNTYGVYGYATTDLVVTNSFVYSSKYGGIATNSGTGAQILNNTLVANGFGGGSSSYLTGAISLGPSGTEKVYNNIITSNYYGFDCNGCDSSWGSNLVWGNTTDWVNDGAATSSDISADPRFTSASEGDYSLSVVSPCIDAGSSTHAAATDRDGEARPQGSGYDIGFDEYAVSSYDLIITEVMANPKAETTGEFVEIYNAGTSAVDLAGLVLTDGDDTDTLTALDGGSTVLGAGEYAVIVDTDYADDYALASGVIVVSVGDSRIGNGLTTSDKIDLFESDGSTRISAFSYPSDPGDGVSLELYDLDTGDAAGNWRDSQCATGSSPGAAHCFPESGDPADLILTEIMANAATESTGEYVEVYNPTDTEIDLAGLVISDGASSDTLVAFGGGSTLLPAYAHGLILDPNYAYDYYLPTAITLVTTGDSTIGNGLSTSDKIYLYESDGSTLIDSCTSPTDPGDGYSLEKVDYTLGDSSSNWKVATDYSTRGRSPGRLNGAALGTCEPLLITEVMANADDEDTGEFVEIYNAGSGAVDLAGLVFTDGDELDTLKSFGGGSTILGAGEYALIVDAEYAGEYILDSSLIVVTTGDTTLGNGLAVTDEIALYEADGQSLIDAFLYPQNPGNAISIERVRYGGALDTDASWTASTCAAGSSPGADNCSGGSTGGESSYDILITEIMANADDESTGEFVELYNAGTSTVDLLNFVLWDGDALDTIIGYSTYSDTLLAPGQYAVILDADYAGEYTLPKGALLLRTDDSTIGSGLATSDPVYIYESDAATLVDSFTFPENPGNAVSIERVDLSTGDIESNWEASSCTSGSSPGQAGC